MEGRVVIQSDSFACDGHCSVRLMKTDEQSRRSHLTSPFSRSSRTSSSHHPISGPSLRSFSLSVNLGLSLSISVSLCRSRPPQIRGFSLGLSPSLSISIANHSIFHTWKHCGRALLRKLIQHSQPLKSG